MLGDPDSPSCNNAVVAPDSALALQELALQSFVSSRIFRKPHKQRQVTRLDYEAACPQPQVQHMH